MVTDTRERESTYRGARRRRGLPLWPMVVVLILVAATLAWFLPDWPDPSSSETETGLSGSEELNALIAESVDITTIPEDITPKPEVADEDLAQIYADKCAIRFRDERTRNRICEYGDIKADTTVVLYGDSHAAHWFPALDLIAEQRGWKLIPLTRSGCPPAMADIVHEGLGRRYTECTQWRQDAFDIMDDLNPALVLTTSVNNHVPVDENDEPYPNPEEVQSEAWAATFTEILDADTAVTYLVDNPNFGRNTSKCLLNNPNEVDKCDIARDEALIRPERTELIIEHAEELGVGIIDTTDWFCTERICPPIVGNILVIHDTSHVTATYMEMIAPVVSDQLPEL